MKTSTRQNMQKHLCRLANWCVKQCFQMSLVSSLHTGMGHLNKNAIQLNRESTISTTNLLLATLQRLHSHKQTPRKTSCCCGRQNHTSATFFVDVNCGTRRQC